MLRADASRSHGLETDRLTNRRLAKYSDAPPQLVVFLIPPLSIVLPFQPDRFSRTRLCNSNEMPGTKQPSMHYCV